MATGKGDSQGESKRFKGKRKIKFDVQERIIPGSMLGVIPFIAEAIAHLTALPDFHEKPLHLLEEVPLKYPEFDWNFHQFSAAPTQAPELAQEEPSLIYISETPPISEASLAQIPEVITPQRESANEPLQAMSSTERVSPSIPEFYQYEEEPSTVEPQPDLNPMPPMPQVDPSNMPPVADLQHAGEVSHDTPILFNASASYDLDGTIVKYQFDFGDGNSYSETPDNAPDGAFDGMTTYTYTQAGLKQTSVTVTDNNGATGSASKSLNVTNVVPVFLNPGDTNFKVYGLENTLLSNDPGLLKDKAGTSWIEGGLDAVKNVVDDPSTSSFNEALLSSSNIVQEGQKWQAIANAFDQDGSISKYDFWLDLNQDGKYSSSEYLGFSKTGEISVDGSLLPLSAGKDYTMVVRALDNSGGFALSYDKFHVNAGPVFLSPGDTNPTKLGLENTLLGDLQHNNDNLATPWIEGKLDAVKNDGSAHTLQNIVPAGSDWTAIANAYDRDGSISKYDFFVKDDSGLYVSLGSSLNGELVIDNDLLKLTAGQTYDMKVHAYDNHGAFVSSIDQFTLNSAPVATPDEYFVNEDSVLNVPAKGVLLNDADLDGNTLLAALVAGPTNGTLTLNSDGSFVYTPNANFFGTDTFTYKANDGMVDSGLATVKINVLPVNDAPVALNDSYSTAEDNALNIPAKGVLLNDSDLEGDTLSAILVSGPANGSLTLSSDGSFVYTPNANFNGSDSFTYKANDGSLDSGVAIVTINVTPVNDAPVAVNDLYSLAEDGVLNVPAKGVLVNDSDPEGSVLSSVLVSGPTNGSLTLNSDGSFVYTPNANFFGADTFTYKANDGSLDSGLATVTINVTPVNDAPLAMNDSYSTAEDNALSIPAKGVLLNDSDLENNVLNAILVSGPANGSLTLGSDGSFIYTPNANFNGTDSFVYKANDGSADSNLATVTITVTPVNDAPDALDDVYVTSEDSPLTVPTKGVLTNDTDLDGDALSAVLVSGPANGSLTLNSDGSFSYTPNTDFVGEDSFVYKAVDGIGGFDNATVKIIVSSIVDPPLAVNDVVVTDEDKNISFNVLDGSSSGGVPDSDSDGGVLTVFSAVSPSFGTISWSPDGNFTYTPNADYFGSDSFTYTISDGEGGFSTATVNITVNPVNDAPLALNDSYSINEDTVLNVPAKGILLNDSDLDGDALSAILVSGPANGTLTLNNDGSFAYTPNANFNGTDTFTYKANDGALDSGTATVTITVSPVNDAPVAANDSYTITEDGVLNVPVKSVLLNGVLFNDSDIDSANLSSILLTQPTNGTLTLNSDGSFLYTPNANFNGTDTFTYKANDGSADSNVATVTITVTPVNDAPDAVNDSVVIGEDTVKDINVLSNDTDLDGDKLTVVAVTQGGNGMVSINPDGTVKYTPNANFFGTDSFTYSISDGQGGSDTATVSITVNPVNDPATGGIDAVATPSLKYNDIDNINLGDKLNFAIDVADVDGIAATAGYTYAIDGGTVFTFNDVNSLTTAINNQGPNLITGTHSLVVTVKDTLGNVSTFNDTIVVSSGNEAPTVFLDAVKDNGSLASSNNVVNPGSSWILAANGTDNDGTVKSYQFFLDINQNGQYEMYLGTSANGELDVTPLATFLGADQNYSVKVIATDDRGATAFATDSFHVNAAPTVTLDSVKTVEPDIIAEKTNWSALANASDIDGTVSKLEFWIDANRDGDFDDAGEYLGQDNPLDGEITITNDLNQLGLKSGLNYNMKTLATDNYGLTGEAFDSFHYGTNSAPVAGDDSNTLSKLFYVNTNYGGYYASDTNIFSLNVDGTGLQQVTPSPLNQIQLVNSNDVESSKDGSRIAFIGIDGFRNPGGSNSLFVMNSDGTNKLTIDSISYPGIGSLSSSTDFDISSDGNYVALSNGNGIKIINTTTGQLVKSISDSGNRLNWSPTAGQELLAYSFGNDVKLVNLQDNTVTTLNGAIRATNSYQWSPSGDKIAFISSTSQSTGTTPAYLYAVNIDSNPPVLTNVTTTASQIRSAFFWSPDGSRLAYSESYNSSNYGNTSLTVSNVSNLAAVSSVVIPFTVPVTTDSFDVLDADSLIWSPDGSKIAVTGFDNGLYSFGDDYDEAAIFVVKSDGTGGFVRITPEDTTSPRLFGNIFSQSSVDAGYLSEYEWSPDGKYIAFEGVKYGNTIQSYDYAFYTVKTDGSGTLYKLAGAANSSPYIDWTADSSKVIFNNQFQSGSSVKKIFTVNPDGTDYAPLFSSTSSSTFNGQRLSGTNSILADNFGSLTLYNFSNNTANAITSPSGNNYSIASYSPDGENLIARSQFYNGNSTQYSYTIFNDKSQVNLSNLVPPSGVQSLSLNGSSLNGRWSPDSSYFVTYGKDSSNQNELVLIKADGSSLINISNTSGSNDAVYSISPDGKYIEIDNGSNLYIYNVATDTKTLISNTDLDSVSQWVPGTSKIILESYTSGYSQSNLVLVDINDPSVRTIIDNPSVTGYISSGDTVSHDGKYIVFYEGGKSYYNTTDGLGTPIETTGTILSPTGNEILFFKNTDLYVSNIDGTNVVQLTNTPSISESLHTWQDASNITRQGWSPDGTQIAFSANDPNSGIRNIYVVNKDGTGFTNITQDKYSSLYTSANWSPDGSKILFYANNGSLYYAAEPDGSSIVEITQIAKPLNTGGSPTSFSPQISVGSNFANALAGSANRLNVLTNDLDPDGDTLSITAVNGSAIKAGDQVTLSDGVLLLNVDNTFSFTPNVTSVDKVQTFSYTVSDGFGGSDTASVSVNIVGVNQAPTAKDDTVTTLEDQSIQIKFLQNDSDPESDALTVSSYTQAVHGLVTLSADGKSFTYIPDLNYNYNGVNGSNAIQLANLTNNSGADSEFKLSADGTKIVFTSERDGNKEIYLMNADGTGQTRLTNNTSKDYGASFSPDGSKILFTSERDGNKELYSMNLDGSGQTNLTNTSNIDESNGSWSPDGTKILFEYRSSSGGMTPFSASGEITTSDSLGNGTNSRSGRYYDDYEITIPAGATVKFNQSSSSFDAYLFLINKSTNATIATDDDTIGTDPQIIYTNSTGGPLTIIMRATTYSSGATGAYTLTAVQTNSTPAYADIYSMNANGSNLVNLTNTASADESGATWSPDGSKIAFTTTRDGNNEIYVANADGSNAANVTKNSANDSGAVWSPDGSKLAFTSNRDGNNEIYVVNADGSNAVNVTKNSASDSGAVWSPNGSKLAFTSNRDSNNEIYLVNADGSNLVNISNNVGDDNTALFSKDGNSVLYSSNRTGNTELFNFNTTVVPVADTFTYTVKDALGNTDSATVTIFTTPVNDPLTALDDLNSKIVYSANDDIYLKNADGTGSPVLIGNDLGSDPVWSPDHLKIAFVTIDGRLATMNADGSNVTVVYTPPDIPTEVYVPSVSVGTGNRTLGYIKLENLRQEILDLSWSPDGSKVVFEYLDGYGDPGGIRTVDINAGTVLFDQASETYKTILALDGDGFYSIVTPVDYKWISSPEWSADGTRLFYYALSHPESGNSTGQLNMFDLTSQSTTTLSNQLIREDSITLSADGSKIAYIGFDNTGNGFLYSLDVSSTGNSPLVVKSYGGALNSALNLISWSPDNQEIIFNDGSAVKVSDGSVRELFDLDLNLVNNDNIYFSPLSAQVNTPLAINVLANDLDVDNPGALTITATSNPQTVISGNQIVFTGLSPGLYTFTYTVSDGFGGTDSGLVTVYVFN